MKQKLLPLLFSMSAIAQPPPNILLINIDDMGWRDVGFMGSEYYETPNLDALAADGMVFTNAYASASNCAPSRAGLMSGQWTQRHGIYTVDSSERGKSKDRKLIPIPNNTILPDSQYTLTEAIKAAGYVTCHAGKWHLSDDPTTQGFDVNIGGNHAGNPGSYYPPYSNVPSLEPPTDDYYLTNLIMDKTLQFLNGVDEQPFFMYYSPYAVHTPIHPVDSLLSKYETKPAWNGQNNAEYATMIENLDIQIGRMIENLKESNKLDNTFILFTSDNGGHYGITKQLPLRSGKGSYYEGGIREPMFVRWPGKVPSGTKTDVPVTNLDFYPTLLEVAGAEKPAGKILDGQSILPVFTQKGMLEERPLFWHFPIYLQAYLKNDTTTQDPIFRTRPGSAVRLGDWKLIQYFENNDLELYNLKEDISENNNLAQTRPEKLQELLTILENWREETNAPVPKELNPEFTNFGGCSKKKQENSLPNIVFILADDMGYGDVSAYNEDSKIKTPFIDQLAEEGVMFTDAHTSSSVCTPTRYGIITGRYNWRSTLKSGVLSGYSKSLIKPERTTIAEFLAENGYRTAFIGKWHMGWDWSIMEEDDIHRDKLNARPKVDFSKPVKNGPGTHGFDYSYGFCGSLDMSPYVWVENDLPTMVPTKTTVNMGDQSWWREGLTSDDFEHEQVLPDITEKTIEFINENAESEKPFFVYMPLSAPHTPILPPEQFKGKSGLDNPYGDFVIMVDWVVGQIAQVLQEKGIDDNTLLIFTTDNGCSPQANFEQLSGKGHDPSYHFRGYKADIYEGGHRVPFVVRWPQKVKPGVSDQMVCTTDLFATVADILDAELEDDMAEDSFSFLSALGIASNEPQRDAIVHHSINGSFALRKGNWKTIFCPGSGGWSAPRPNAEGIEDMPQVQLYNLKSDVEEQTNLQDKVPEIVEAHRKLLTNIVSNGRSTPGTPQENDGPETWPQLDWMNK